MMQARRIPSRFREPSEDFRALPVIHGFGGHSSFVRSKLERSSRKRDTGPV